MTGPTTGAYRWQSCPSRSALHAALIEARDAELRLPCSGDERFTSDARAEREAAAAECVACPVLAACLGVGRLERFGVWGGQDHTPQPQGDPR